METPARHAREHLFQATLRWSGETGASFDYATYSRAHSAHIEGKPDLACTAAPEFKGDPRAHNPEDLFLVAVSSCHMLSYLALCARRGIRVLAYEDDARAALALTPDGGGKFSEITLRPRVRIADAARAEEARALHDRAHHICFIANSTSSPIRHEPVIETA